MEIDNYGQAIALQRKLEATLPFQVKPTKRMMKAVKDKTITLSTWLEVDRIMYAGDSGGIMVTILSPDGQEVYAMSLTHVVIDPDHELAPEVMAYQKRRTRQLRLNDRGSLVTEFSIPPSRKKKTKKRKGFG